MIKEADKNGDGEVIITYIYNFRLTIMNLQK